MRRGDGLSPLARNRSKTKRRVKGAGIDCGGGETCPADAHSGSSSTGLMIADQEIAKSEDPNPPRRHQRHRERTRRRTNDAKASNRRLPIAPLPKRLKNMKICTKVYTSGGLRQGSTVESQKPRGKSQKRALRQPKFLKQASISYSHGTETESLVDAKARQLREGNRAEPDVHQWIAGAAFYRIKTGPDGQRNSDNAAS
jgi:hypothetical protein